MEWINVNDRFPNHEDLVLIYCSRCGVNTDRFYNDKWEYCSFADLEVTHWMPLPKPPKNG